MAYMVFATGGNVYATEITIPKNATGDEEPWEILLMLEDTTLGRALWESNLFSITDDIVGYEEKPEEILDRDETIRLMLGE